MQPLEIGSGDSILIVAPHPDDECIGAGGILTAYAGQTDVWVLSDGRYGSHDIDPEELVEIRKREFIAEMEYLGIRQYRLFGLEDKSLQNHLSVLDNVSLAPYSVILVPHREELHPDHSAAYQIVSNAVRKQGLRDVTVYQYEVSTPMRMPSHYMDITDRMQKKRECIELHESQIREVDYYEVARSLNSFRAYLLCLRNSYVEAYCISDPESE